MLMNTFIGKCNVYFYRFPVNENIPTETLDLPVSGVKTSLSLEPILIIFLDLK